MYNKYDLVAIFSDELETFGFGDLLKLINGKDFFEICDDFWGSISHFLLGRVLEPPEIAAIFLYTWSKEIAKLVDEGDFNS